MVKVARMQARIAEKSEKNSEEEISRGKGSAAHLRKELKHFTRLIKKVTSERIRVIKAQNGVAKTVAKLDQKVAKQTHVLSKKLRAMKRAMGLEAEQLERILRRKSNVKKLIRLHENVEKLIRLHKELVHLSW